MPGLWERIKPGNDRVSIHFLTAAIYLAGRNVFTDVQVRNHLNARLATPLDAAAETDLLNIKTQATTGSATARIDYMLRLESIGIAVEAGALTSEATWRSEMGIT